MKETSKKLFREAIFMFSAAVEEGFNGQFQPPFGYGKEEQPLLYRVAEIIGRKPPKTD